VKLQRVVICRLEASDVENYRAVRLTSLRTEPEAFSSVYEVEAARPFSDFAERLATSIVFGAYAGRDVVGLAGFKQEAGLKSRHKGLVEGVYSRPAWRGQGISSALMAAVIESAREVVEQLHLAVTKGNVAAISLYRKFGFEIYGVEPRAKKSPTGYCDNVLMVRTLSREPN
jgi:ribosomal protein S18 acetylase RimI-like enzyme